MNNHENPAEWLKARSLETQADGRNQRASKSRTQIIQAMLDLVREGNSSPNAAQVADRAQLGLRSVFRHFKDMESLFYGMLEEVQELILPIASRPITGSSFAERLESLINIRIDVYQRIYPYQSAVELYINTSPLLQKRRTIEAQFLRLQLNELLSERENIDPEIIEAVELILCFVAWRRMRDIQGLTTPQIKNIVARAVLKLID